ncbi:MAG: hypothetical protein R3362_00380 [Rhodothermales bacterium]|nr:hypothetical protein [Rhodothermales bacterium]
MSQAQRIEAVAAAAESWRDPDHESREAAVEATLEAENRFTEEGLAFALNHFTHHVNRERLDRWLDGAAVQQPVTAGVAVTGEEPLGGAADLLAPYVLGHAVVASVPASSPALWPAFFEAVAECGGPPVRFVPSRALFDEAEAVAAVVEADVLDEWQARCERAGIPPTRRFLRPARYAVAVLDGREDRSERSGFAEDLLLHDGYGRQAVRVVWAPEEHAPDAMLEALAGFREVFPAHPDTHGSLAMPAAFLEAADVPRAQGPGFLVSKGEPEPQPPGHVRWSTYSQLGEVREWLRAHADAVEFASASARVREGLSAPVPAAGPGDAHRLPLAWHRRGEDPVAFWAGV